MSPMLITDEARAVADKKTIRLRWASRLARNERLKSDRTKAHGRLLLVRRIGLITD